MSGTSNLNPNEALQELLLQEQLVNNAVDIQALLRMLIDKKLITREDVSKYRNEVKSSPKYANAINTIESQKKIYEKAIDNPQEYLKALFKAKMDGQRS